MEHVLNQQGQAMLYPIIISYVLVGTTNVILDFRDDETQRPNYTNKPNIFILLFAILMWAPNNIQYIIGALRHGRPYPRYGIRGVVLYVAFFVCVWFLEISL